MASYSRTLYIGLTNDLERRVWEHKNRWLEGFASKYNIDRLVYFEEHDGPRSAITREKQLKGWRRDKKTSLIESVNPDWSDLAENWGQGDRGK